MISRKMATSIALALAAVFIFSPAFAGGTLDKVRQMGAVSCGVSEDMPGFATRDASGRWQGFAVDFCRAVAVAVLGDPEKVKFTPLTPAARFPVLLGGKVDLLADSSTITFGREAGIGALFAGTYYFDGQAFMVPAKSKFKKIEDLNGATICVEKGTTHLPNLENTFRPPKSTYTPIICDSLAEVRESFFAGRCQAYSGDRSRLTGLLSSAPGGPSAFRVLPGDISKEPLGPVVRRGDDEWLTLVRWVLHALVEAEERGVTKANVKLLREKKDDPGLQWFLNSSGKLGKSLGLKPDWTAEIVGQVGNYGEMFERHIGKGPLKTARGLNRLWNKGGLLYAPPFQ